MSFRPSPSLIPIGSFSAATLLTQKTLRFYAEHGILKPAWVDPENGYRYYRGEQVSLARRIQMMRELGMSLSDVSAVNAAAEESPESAAARLNQFWVRRMAQFEVDCDTYRALLFGLLDPEATDTAAAARVQQRDEAGGWVLCREVDANALEIGTVVGESMALLNAAAAAAQVRVRGPGFTRCRGFLTPDAPTRVQISLPLAERIDAPEGMRLWQDTPHRIAYVRVTGTDCEFPRFLLGLEMVVDWLVDNGKLFVGHVPRVFGVPEAGEPGLDLALDIGWPYLEPEDPIR